MIVRASGQPGFTLVEVLIAMAITAIVSMLAYSSLSTVFSAVESLRETTRRTYEVNRAFMIISRDFRHFVRRPIRDEFGDVEAALTGGSAAPYPLSLTRSGWYNPNAHPRSNLQRINYRLEDESLWRDAYPVLDRTGDSEPQSALLLEEVEYLEVAFLESLSELPRDPDGDGLDTRDWPDSWVTDPAAGADTAPPVAVELRLQLDDLGEIKRLYVLPPL